MQDRNVDKFVDHTCSTLDTLQCSLTVDPTGKLRLVWMEMGGRRLAGGWLEVWLGGLLEGWLGGWVCLDEG